MAAQSYTVDPVALRDAATFNQVVATAKLLRASVFEVSELMQHPLETGSEVADHIVRKLIEIDLPLMITGDQSKQVFGELRQLYLNASLLTVQTRMRAYANMVLLEIPHDETAEGVDAITVSVRLREARFRVATYGGLAPAQVKAKPKASTTQKGAQQTTAPAAPKAAAANDLYKGSTLYKFAHRRD